MNHRKFIIFPVVALGALLFFIACDKNNENPNQPMIPNVPVNFYLQPNTIDYIVAGSGKSYDNEGNRGVYIYRLDQYNFLAYEKTCPYDPDKSCAVVQFDPTTFTLIDSCCMSRFNLVDGMPVEGPATLPLIQYMTEFDGNYLHVFNGK